jgi:DNA-directed RNA polymerase subunit alpha
MISLPKSVKIVEKKKNYAKFEIEGLWPGYGVTIGNSLRRVLLSSLEGGAVTKVKIKGVAHEFSTIPGVLEDVISIIQNLKGLRFRVFSEEPQKAILKVKGEKEVLGSDLKLPPQLELANPDWHIATLTTNSAKLEMEIWVEKGIGYLPKEARKEETEVGVILVDAIFTPVKKVNFKVENMRVGERTDFNRLFVEIETDGILSPEEAFKKAAEILKSHFEFLIKEKYEKA